MPDTLSPADRSRRMSSIRGKDTKPEMIVRRLVHAMGFRYRLHRKDLPGHPDLVFVKSPIYVGQAAPAVNNARTPMEQGDRLCRRLDDHRKNIGNAESTLSLADFECRTLVVQSGWETAAEDYLIHLFKPIWNSEIDILYGLGKHGDSAETRGNKRSPWDTLHPGRAWAPIPRCRTPRRWTASSRK